MNAKNRVLRVGFLLVSVVAAAGLVFFGCATDEVVPEQYEPDDTYTDYLRAVRDLAMDETRIGANWVEAGDPQKADPVLAAAPFEEIRLLDVTEQQAVFYLIEGLRGHRLDISIQGPEESGYFVDVFRLPDEWRPGDSGTDSADSPEEPWRQGELEAAASAGAAQTGDSSMHFEPLRHRFYLVRLQPRLLEGGEFTIRLTADAALAWPVPETDHRNIWSAFGAPRDGGVRVHHGVDIFAARHTPLLSISDSSEVRRVGERDRGGNIVSLTDRKRNLLLYYAHLEAQEQGLEGTEIPAGTRIGTMGNSGNAVTTPPHLHIGIYEGSWRRPVDPWYFIVPVEQTPPQPADPPTAMGDYLEIVGDSIVLRAYPPQQSAILPSPAVTDGDGQELPQSAYPLLRIPEGPARGSRLPAGSIIRLKGVLGEYALAEADDGTRGYVPLSGLQAAPDGGEAQS